MIGIEAETYWGDNWLLIRTWDGIDKPLKARIFKITEEEIDFEGGRFERMVSMYAAQQSSFQKLVIGMEKQTIEEIINWVSENTVGFWNFEVSISDDCFYDGEVHDSVWIFHFEDDEMAMAFKLRWS